MSPFRRVLLWSLFPLLLASCATLERASAPRETTVWGVRHAEKATDDPKDPSLSEAGRARALVLAERLGGEKLEAIFVTRYKRSGATAEPLARGLGKDVQLYAPQDFAGLRERILSGFRGKTVLVVGHSNSLLEFIEALGGARPVPALAEEDYDFLFRVTLPERGAASVETLRYGAVHHQSTAPARASP